MSSEIAIKAEGLGKRYRIGAGQLQRRHVGEALGEVFLSPLKRAGRLIRGDATGAANLTETFWAVRDVSFEVKEGEVVGLIGRNGAGKSTLLKILSRITPPSEGRAELHGRVGALLEVGTGFHPELTGRENVHLSGAILGMRRAELDQRFDEIVEFAELARFIDTPVKHYSSGMYTRLAFSVAAHLEPEILLIDEVLAVGDHSFQKKCLGKMGGVAREGRTVLFVSHNLAAVQSLCPRTLVVEEGSLVYDGPTPEAMARYLRREETFGGDLDLEAFRGFCRRPVLKTLRLLDADHEPRNGFASGTDVVIELELESEEALQGPEITIGVNNSLGSRAFTVKPRWQGQTLSVGGGRTRVRCRLEAPPLVPDQYFLKIVVDEGYSTLDVVEDVPAFEIEERDYWGTGSLPSSINQGIVLQRASWTCQPEPAGTESEPALLTQDAARTGSRP